MMMSIECAKAVLTIALTCLLIHVIGGSQAHAGQCAPESDCWYATCFDLAQRTAQARLDGSPEAWGLEGQLAEHGCQVTCEDGYWPGLDVWMSLPADFADLCTQPPAAPEPALHSRQGGPAASKDIKGGRA